MGRTTLRKASSFDEVKQKLGIKFKPGAIKLSEKVNVWSAELQLLCFKTAKAVLLPTDRFLNLMAVMPRCGI